MQDRSENWPPLPYGEWRDTAATLHLWLQIVGKIALVKRPWVNHSWHVALRITARGIVQRILRVPASGPLRRVAVH